MKKGLIIILCTLLISLCATANSFATTVALGGSSYSNLATALNSLGQSYTDFGTGNYPTSGYDVVIVGMDGGNSGWQDMNGYLNAGGRLAVFGGSNFDPYYAWVNNYFNTTLPNPGWYTSSATPNFVKLVDSPILQYLPNTFNYDNISDTYHMVNFSNTQPAGTTILAGNSEPNNIAALRSYNNSGNFFYFAQDINQYGNGVNDQNFTKNLLKGYLEYNGSGNPPGPSAVPEPATMSLLGLGLLGLIRFKRKGEVKA